MQLKNYLFLFLSLSIFASACTNNTANTAESGDKALQDSVQKYLDAYNIKYKELYSASSEAAWAVNTHIVEGDSTNAVAAQKADEAMAAFTGSKENIEKARAFLDKKGALTSIQTKQLEKILYAAANNPEILKDVVKQRIKAETAQTEKLFGFNFKLNGKKVSTNDIDSILTFEKDVRKRQAAWESSKEVGKELKNGLANLRDLRNQTVKGLGYPDYFNYQVSESLQYYCTSFR
ncbi:MAG: hypothetical protein EOP53_15500 [Sphingobacteriales bacterium]|nr:MAG: hypothetical protein EOP53_15500 [Sphingobacteriales bacterium]